MFYIDLEWPQAWHVHHIPLKAHRSEIGFKFPKLEIVTTLLYLKVAIRRQGEQEKVAFIHRQFECIVLHSALPTLGTMIM